MANSFIERLAARRRFGMRPGLETVRALCAALGDPQKRIRAIHVAGTNGKGAVCALLDAALREARPPSPTAGDDAGASGSRLLVGRYTSPHLVKLNERFFIDGSPIPDETLQKFAKTVENVICNRGLSPLEIGDVTFFEALTAVAFLAFADANVDYGVLECGLGGRLDATNICAPVLCVITHVGLDHCGWLGDTVEKIAAEKAGIIKPGVPVVLGRNDSAVRAVVEARAREVGAPFVYAPEVASEADISAEFPLRGGFNRENAVTAVAALKTLASHGDRPHVDCGERPHVEDGDRPRVDWSLAMRLPSSVVWPGRFQRVDCGDRPHGKDGDRTRVDWSSAIRLPSSVVWPGRFQRVGDFILDGAHNPPAAAALAAALAAEHGGRRLPLVAGFCGDKDVDGVLAALAPRVSRGFAVRTNNPRSLSAEETAARMLGAGIAARPCASLREALRLAAEEGRPALVCGSLFLVGEALVELGAYPWGGGSARFDPSEMLSPFAGCSASRARNLV